MGTELTWSDIALRLLLTVVAGSVIGVNRGEHGRPVGLRTTLLVCLAASVSMIQVNLLLTMQGRASNSFVMLDLMRLPLGILSGMGFIGAGAIMKKDNLVVGVTTAATLWFITVMGLCFGGGQLALGLIALVLGFITLEFLKPVEKAWKQDRQAKLTVVVSNQGAQEADIAKTIVAAGYRILSQAVTYDATQGLREIHYQVKWRGRVDENDVPSFVPELAARQSTLKVSWDP